MHCSYEAYLQELIESGITPEDFKEKFIEMYVQMTGAIKRDDDSDKDYDEKMNIFFDNVEDLFEGRKPDWTAAPHGGCLGSLWFFNNKYNIEIAATPYYENISEESGIPVSVYFPDIDYEYHDFIELPREVYLTPERYLEHMEPFFKEANAQGEVIKWIIEKAGKNSEALLEAFKKEGHCPMCGRGHKVGDCK